jgi:mono/diheme cytochrome c family protein
VVEREVGMRGFRSFLVVGLALWIGCSDEPAPPAANSGRSTANESGVTVPAPKESPAPSPQMPQVPEALSAEEMIEAGRSVYNANCIACHSLDPTKDGALGPAVAGASLGLLEARVIRAEYPDAYEPKRATRVMIALPHLEPRLPELAAYLESLD